jgi:hypothetical protein
MQQLFTLRRASHASPVALATLLAVNAIPLVGVLFLGWDLATIVATYWLENGVIGLFAIGRIATAQRSSLAIAGPIPGVASTTLSRIGSLERIFLVPFFCVHYGMFWFVHGVFVWAALPSVFAGFSGGDMSAPAGPNVGVVLTMGIPLMLSHGASFVFNWLGGGEFRASTPSAEMAAPYVRVVILHLTIIFGAFTVAFLGAPIWAMIVMVALKTGVDVAAHLAERNRAGLRMALTGRASMAGAPWAPAPPPPPPPPPQG